MHTCTQSPLRQCEGFKAPVLRSPGGREAGKLGMLECWLPRVNVRAGARMGPAGHDSRLCFREAYPNCTVLEARPCYNVARLMFLDAERYRVGHGEGATQSPLLLREESWPPRGNRGSPFIWFWGHFEYD